MHDHPAREGADLEAEVTRLRERVAELEGAEARLRRIVNSAFEVIVTADAEGRFTFVSDAAADVFGYPPEEYTRSFQVGGIAHPEDKPAVQSAMEWILGHPGEPVSRVVRVRHRDGSWRWVEARATNLLEDPDVGAMVSVYRDVTDHHHAEEAGRRSEALLAESQRIAGIGSFVRDLRDGSVEWSRNMYALAGLDPEVAGPCTPALSASIVHPEDREKATAQIIEMVEARRTWPTEFRLLRPDGEVRIVRSAARFDVDEAGEPVRVLGVLFDVTDQRQSELERERLEARVQQVDKLESLAVLAGGIAHDFNNILVAILGNVALLRMDLPADASVEESLSEIDSAVRRASDLARQMLAYSGGGVFAMAPLDLNAVVRQMIDLLAPGMREGVEVGLELSEGELTITADGAQMRQVVTSLVTNAAESVETGPGAVTIRTGVVDANRACFDQAHVDDRLPEGRYALLEVSDTGAGMDDETKARLFDPFFTTKFIGRGLGLSAVLGIVRGIRGAIVVESEPGRGATFRVLLPFAEGAE